MRAQTRWSAALAAALLLGAVSPAKEAAGKDAPKKPAGDSQGGGLFEKLAGPGGKATFLVGKLPDGTAGSLHTSFDKERQFKQFEAKGTLNLDSTQMKLRCEYILYDGKSGLLTAEKGVHLETEEVKATCDKLEYNVNSGSATLTGSPDVTQSSGDGSLHFGGMDQFILTRSPDGQMDVRSTGAEQIKMDFQSGAGAPPAAGASPAPPPAAKPKPKPKKDSSSTGAEGGEGLAGFGRNVSIVTARGAKEPPEVYASIGSGGAVGVFRATGSVLLKSEQIDLRCDQLQYDGLEQRAEALHNVYVKLKDYEADCGRTVYEIDKGTITLTGSPDVRGVGAREGTRINNVDPFIIHRKADGSFDTEMLRGAEPGGVSITKVEKKKEPSSKDSPTTGPIEIVIDPARAEAGGAVPGGR